MWLVWSNHGIRVICDTSRTIFKNNCIIFSFLCLRQDDYSRGVCSCQMCRPWKNVKQRQSQPVTNALCVKNNIDPCQQMPKTSTNWENQILNLIQLLPVGNSVRQLIEKHSGKISKRCWRNKANAVQRRSRHRPLKENMSTIKRAPL